MKFVRLLSSSCIFYFYAEYLQESKTTIRDQIQIHPLFVCQTLKFRYKFRSVVNHIVVSMLTLIVRQKVTFGLLTTLKQPTVNSYECNSIRTVTQQSFRKTKRERGRESIKLTKMTLTQINISFFWNKAIRILMMQLTTSN